VVQAPPPVAATPVPTLSGMMLIVLALLLAAVAYRILRQKENNASRMMVLSLLTVGALASGLGGVTLINDAYASIPGPNPTVVDLTDPNGNTVGIHSGTKSYINKTGEVTEILERSLEDFCIFRPIINQCTIGKQLAVDEVCDLKVECGQG